MELKKLFQLLSQKEGANLEFKRQFYDIYGDDKEAKRRQKHEMIKDIISLANGNESVAGESSYLIVGADNGVNELGYRNLFDISETKIPSEIELLGMVNAFCEPAISELKCHIFEIDSKKLLVIEIPPSPHLHETTEKLETPSQTYSRFVTLVRHNEGVVIAAAKQRDAIQRLKQVKIAEIENPPDLVGGLVGFTLGYITGGVSPFPLTSDLSLNEEISPFAGGVMGSIYGYLIGKSHHIKYKIQKENPQYLGLIEVIWYVVVLLSGFITLFLLKIGVRELEKGIKSSSKN